MRVLLTGCSRGLGLELTHQLLANKFDVLGISRNKPENIKHQNFHWECVDLLELKKLGPICANFFLDSAFDVVIHNAGLGLGKLTLEEQDFTNLFKLHFEAPFIISNMAIKAALARNTKSSGKSSSLRIVNMSSMSVHIPFRGLGSYSASKAALEAMARTYVKEWGDYGIDVINVCPDYMETDMTGDVATSVKQRIVDSIPDKKPLTADRVAQIIVNDILGDKNPWGGKSIIISKRRLWKKKLIEAEWIE